MRNLALFLGACSLGALFACSDSGPAAVGTGAEVGVLTVNGAPAASASAAVDSVYLTAEIRLEAGAPAVTSVALVVEDGTDRGTANVSVAPGTKATVTVGSHLIQSGAQTVRVQARSADGSTVATSAPVTLTVTRPRTYLRVLSVNGAPLPAAGSFAAVADSFLVEVMLVAADAGPSIERIVLRRDSTEFTSRTLNNRLVQVEPGQTYRFPFVAWIAVPGRYGVIMDVDHLDQTLATSGRIPVSVTNSDVTPPTIKSPANELVVSSATGLHLEVFDARGVWQYGLEKPGACSTYAWLGIASPATTATVTRTANSCLTPGRNRLIRRAIDTAGNVTTDEVIVNFVPPASAAAAPRAAEPVRTILRRLPDGTVERVTGPADGS